MKLGAVPHWKALSVGTITTLVVAGMAYAYFTSQLRVNLGTIKTASLVLAAQEIESLSTANWIPGESRSSTWELENTGSIPLYAKGYLDGVWSDDQLSPAVVSITKIERKENNTWSTVLEDQEGITEEFYHSQLGTQADLLSLEPGQKVQYRFTTMLGADTTDAYQLQEFTQSLHLAARQTTAGAIWPVGY